MFDDTTNGYDDSGCCPAPAPDPLPAYEPPAPAPLPPAVPAPAATWLDEAPAVSEPAPLIIEPAPAAASPVVAPAVVEPAPVVIEPAPMAAAPSGASVGFEAAPSGGAALVINADPSAATALNPDAWKIDQMLENARAGLGSSPSMPLAPAGTMLPTPADPSLWGGTPLPGGLFPTSDVDGDGIDNASDSAPFTPAPRRP